MIVLIDEKKTVQLVEPLDFKRFHLEIRGDRATLPALRQAFAAYGTIDDDGHAWIDAEALRSWPGPAQDPAYRAGIDGMLGYAAKKGWMSDDGKRVRAHIVWTAAPDA